MRNGLLQDLPPHANEVSWRTGFFKAHSFPWFAFSGQRVYHGLAGRLLKACSRCFARIPAQGAASRPCFTTYSFEFHLDHQGYSVENETSFRRFSAVLAIVAGVLAFATLFISFGAAEVSLDGYLYPGSEVPAEGSLTRIGAYADMFGYYLLLAPLALLIGSELKTQGLWGQLFTFSALAYIVLGTVGAAILAATIPGLTAQITQSSGEAQPALTIVYASLQESVVWGIWNGAELLLAGFWWLGLRTWAAGHGSLFRWLTILLGLGALLTPLFVIADLRAASLVPLGVYLILAPIWSIWIGIRLLRLHAPVPGQKPPGAAST